MPRPAGGDAEAAARAYCHEQLASLGFDVVERPFTYSTIPGRWATSGAGILSFASLGAAALLGRSGRPGFAAALLMAVLFLLALGGAWLARHGTTRLSTGRASAVNLEARPAPYGQALEPTVWLVAHLDSKSQPVPMLLRAGGITLTGLAWLAMLVLSIVAMTRGGDAMPWGTLGIVGMLAALPVAASTVGARSAGALDNASGVASVLAAAARVPRSLPVGVLLTSAEELGLAGARAWIASGGAPARACILNCDGVDDEGALVLMYSGRRPAALLDAAASAAHAEGLEARPRRLLTGVLVDAVAFADAGHQALTVSRGTPRTLARIHRPSDDLAHLAGTGVAEAARLLAALAIHQAER
ncbi:MAG TPA: M28 family peptidase [Gemmatimonadaceae bacterium]|nr:M28 family peptidase [Gemmatimonadaceae bacterium]